MSVLQDMVDGYPKKIVDLGTSIANSQAAVVDLEAKRDAVIVDVLNVTTSATNSFGAAKASQLSPSGGYTHNEYQQVDDANPNSAFYPIGQNPTVAHTPPSNIRDWQIKSYRWITPAPPGSPYKQYGPVIFRGVNETDPTQVQRAADFDIGYDHIHRPLGLDGTYGLRETIDNINVSISISQKDKAKVESLEVTYTKFL